MAEFFVHHSLNRTKAVKFNMTLRNFVVLGEEGDHKWTLEIGTFYPGADGDTIPSERVHNVDVNNLDEAIESAVANICAKIDWSPLEEDVEPPYVAYNSIEDGTTVAINNFIQLIIEDHLLSAGIDLSEMKVVLNNGTVDFDITSEVTVEGDPYQYKIEWEPPKRVYSRYDE